MEPVDLAQAERVAEQGAEPTLEELERAEAKRLILSSFPHFFSYCSDIHIIPGWHVKKICRIIDRAVKRVEGGEDVFLVLNVCRQHGKSQISSRTLPAWVLLRNPTWNVVLCAHSKPLAYDFAFDVRKLFRRIGQVYGLGIEEDRDQIGVWRTSAGGGMFSTGILSASVGRGCRVLIIEDPFPDAIAAESRAYRDNVWRAITQDFLPMRAPGSLVLFVCNRWDVDDPPGRIMRLNDPNSGEYDPHFPRFEFLRFPAWLDAPDPITGQPAGWLFPERYSEEEYLAMRSVLGRYGWAAQVQQDPIVRSGNLLKIGDAFDSGRVRYVRDWQWPESLRWRRGWDLASSLKERMSDDPDWTCGTLAAYDPGDNESGVPPRLFVRDVKRVRMEGPERNDLIRRVAIDDGPAVRVIVEAVAGYKDAYTTVRDVLSGLRTVHQFVTTRDKFARATVLEAVFERGEIWLPEGASWIPAWADEIGQFPHGRHDDQVDSLVVAVHSDIMGNAMSERMSFSMA